MPLGLAISSALFDTRALGLSPKVHSEWRLNSTKNKEIVFLRSRSPTKLFENPISLSPGKKPESSLTNPGKSGKGGKTMQNHQMIGMLECAKMQLNVKRIEILCLQLALNSWFKDFKSKLTSELSAITAVLNLMRLHRSPRGPCEGATARHRP